MSAVVPGGRARRRARLGLALRSACLAAAAAAAAAPSAGATAPAPQLGARSASVFEAATGMPVFARDAGRRHLIASTTKLMTALVTVAAPLRLSHHCTAPPYAAAPAESQIGLRAGERMSVHDLLLAMMLPSANDAANALSICVAGSRAAFVARMNAQAHALGLRRTHFSTPVGLDDGGNYATAADLARLGIAARRDPFLRRAMDLPRALLRSGSRKRLVVNRNDLVREVPWVNGVKTGHTNAAGYILVASGTQHGLTFVDAVLGDPSEAARDRDALALLKWAFASYRLATPVRAGAVLARLRVQDDPGGRVDVVAARSVRLPIARDAVLRTTLALPDRLAGPLRFHARVGTLTVRAGGRVLARVRLLSARALPRVSLLARAGLVVARPGSLVVLVALLGGVAALLLRRRGGRRRRRRADMEAA